MDALTDTSLWGPIWKLTRNAQERAQTRRMIVEAVLALGASWDFRVMDAVKGWPLQLLVLLSPSTPCTMAPQRQLVAQRLLATPDCCLQSRHTVYQHTGVSDMALKMKHAFKNEFEEVAASGRVPVNLFGALLAWRSHLFWEAKSTEVLQLTAWDGGPCGGAPQGAQGGGPLRKRPGARTPLPKAYIHR